MNSNYYVIVKSNNRTGKVGMASIRDVARRAGVGVGTVSRVINGTGYVSADTRKKIESAIEELQYKPNELARNLFRNKTGIVGILVPDVDHPFFSSYVRQTEAALYEMGYKTLIGNTIGISNREREFLDMLDRNMVDGIILGTHMLAESEYQNLDLPIVAFDYRVAEEIPTIYSDHNKGGLLAANEIIKNDCKCVLNVTAVVTDKSPSINRHRVFSETLKKNGVKCIDYIWNTKQRTEEYHQQMNKLFDEYPEMDAMFSEDLIIMNALKCAGERGMCIPDEFKAVGYDGTLIAKISYPSMTYVSQPIKELADTLVDVLLKKINGAKLHEDIILKDVCLVKGQTTE